MGWIAFLAGGILGWALCCVFTIGGRADDESR